MIIDARERFEARRDAVDWQRFHDEDFARVDAAVAKLVDRLTYEHNMENVARSLMARAQMLLEEVAIQKTL